MPNLTQNEKYFYFAAFAALAGIFGWILSYKRDPNAPKEEPWVMLARFSSLEAHNEESMHQLCAQLNEAGVPATFESTIGGSFVKNFQLQVHEKDLAKAQVVLGEILDEDSEST